MESQTSDDGSEPKNLYQELGVGHKVVIRREIHFDGRISPPGSPYHPMVAAGSVGTIVDGMRPTGAFMVQFNLGDKHYVRDLYIGEIEPAEVSH